jgi:hypothetical protein
MNMNDAVQSVVRDLRKRVQYFGAREAIFARARQMAKAEGMDFYAALGRMGKHGGKKSGAIRRAKAPQVLSPEQRAKQLADMEKRGLW